MYPLEGYLYADTYFVTADISDIEGFTEMCLDRMDEVLTERKDAIKASGFSVHELLTLTSIVTKEATAEEALRLATHKLPVKCKIVSKADLEGGESSENE